jgi:hypothetical protein
MSSNLSHSQKLHLDELIKNNNAVDNTAHIREVKHSKHIKNDIATFLSLKKTYPRLSPDLFEKMCIHRCSFLFNNYTDIYNRLIKDELNIELFSKFISVLEKIENGDENQHTGSVIIGTLLKEIYIDSAIRKENKSTKTHERKERRQKNLEKKKNKTLKENYPEEYKKATLSWKEYKADTLNKQ